MGAAEDVALYGLRTSLGSILENFGFGTVSEDSVDLLSDIMRKFITNVATKSKYYTEHAGRTDAACKDIALAFRKIHFNTSELCDFANQNNFPPPKPFPKFPVVKPTPRPLYHPQPSEKELETRPEHIPQFLQAAHPEWTKEGADYLAVMKPSTSADKKGAAPDFPSFEGCSAKDMGLRKEDRKPPPPVITRTDDSSATGIRSSANIASQRLYNPDYAAQLSKKKNKPLSALREGGSRSTTPIGRTNSPFEPGSEDRGRTDSPSTSKSAEKQKFKPRPPSSAARILFEPKPNEPSTSAASALTAGSYEEASQSPMPRLEQEEQIAGETSLSVPQLEYEESFETPPRIDENLITANILLFQQLKQQQEREAKDKQDKERQKEAKQKKKEEQKEKKREAARIKEEQKKEQEMAKKLAKEEDKRRKKEEKARLAAEAKARAKEAQKLEAEKRLEEALRAQTSTPIQSSYTPSIVDEGEQKPLKLLITNPMSSNASSTFSPSPIRAPPSLREVTPAPSIVQTNDDEDTIPFYADTSLEGDTTFPMNMSLNSTETPTPKKEKKKKHKKDKHRDASPSSHKKHKKDKEHKKHKKEKRERDEKDTDREHKHKHKETPVKETKPAEPEQKPLTLKIRLGDQTPSNNDYSPYQQHEPVRLKFKFSSDKKEEEKVPPLRLGIPSVPKDCPTSAEKVRVHKPEKTKSPYDKEKEEKQKRREERKRKDREEAEERQKAELERLKREHELKQKRESEEKKRHEDHILKEQREREERERRKEKEREQKLKMEKELALISATTECLFSKKEKEKFKIDKYDKEKEKKKEAPPPPPPPPAPALAPAPVHVPVPAPAPAPAPVEEPDEEEEDEKLWICPSCHVAWTEGANMVACDICNDWFHWHCVGLLVAPEDDIPWFCKKCSRKPLKRPSKSSTDSPKKKKKTEGFGYLK